MYRVRCDFQASSRSRRSAKESPPHQAAAVRCPAHGEADLPLPVDPVGGEHLAGRRVDRLERLPHVPHAGTTGETA